MGESGGGGVSGEDGKGWLKIWEVRETKRG